MPRMGYGRTRASASGPRHASRSAERRNARTSQKASSSKTSTKPCRRARRRRSMRGVSAGAGTVASCVASRGSGSAAAAGTGSAPRRERVRVRIPAASAVTMAASGRATAMAGPRYPYVRRIESIPVSGVEIRKATTAPGFAPLRLNSRAAGTTLQEQRGSGAPRTVARNTGRRPPPPSSPAIRCERTNSARRPARRKPPSRKRLPSRRTRISADVKVPIKLIGLHPVECDAVS
jgi:hypothetical protein